MLVWVVMRVVLFRVSLLVCLVGGNHYVIDSGCVSLGSMRGVRVGSPVVVFEIRDKVEAAVQMSPV